MIHVDSTPSTPGDSVIDGLNFNFKRPSQWNKCWVSIVMWGYFVAFFHKKNDSTGNNPDFIVIWGCKQLFLYYMRRSLLEKGEQARPVLYYYHWKKKKRVSNDNKKWKRKVAFFHIFDGNLTSYLFLLKNTNFLTNNEFQCKKMHSDSVSEIRVTICDNFYLWHCRIKKVIGPQKKNYRFSLDRCDR